MKTINDYTKDYMKNIANAKKVKKILEKSGLRENILKSCEYIINNYKLEDEVNGGLRDFCSKNNISQLSGYSCIFKPQKIDTFSEPYLQLVKKWIEKGDCDERLTNRGSYDYTIHVNGKKAWYSREYKGCGNGYYYLMLNHDTVLFYEKD